jgi:hypothetical protein
MVDLAANLERFCAKTLQIGSTNGYELPRRLRSRSWIAGVQIGHQVGNVGWRQMRPRNSPVQHPVMRLPRGAPSCCHYRKRGNAFFALDGSLVAPDTSFLGGRLRNRGQSSDPRSEPVARRLASNRSGCYPSAIVSAGPARDTQRPTDRNDARGSRRDDGLPHPVVSKP